MNLSYLVYNVSDPVIWAISQFHIDKKVLRQNIQYRVSPLFIFFLTSRCILCCILALFAVSCRRPLSCMTDYRKLNSKLDEQVAYMYICTQIPGWISTRTGNLQFDYSWHYPLKRQCCRKRKYFRFGAIFTVRRRYLHHKFMFCANSHKIRDLVFLLKCQRKRI